MNRASDPPVDGDPVESSLDAELGRILEAYLADLEAGRPVDPERLLAQHPALADQLRSCLAVVNLADRVAGGSRSHAAPDRAASRLDTTASARVRSALTTLGLGSNGGSRVYLREMPDEPEPMIRPRSDAMPISPESAFGRYQLQGEIARGGMGAVLRGRDVDLGRDLAIKVLLEAHRDHPDIVHRFIEEAQIGGQLQHPGIVPVYELGTFPDRRPYFAMKLVKGRTLAALLQERPDPRHEVPRFLSIFEQVCQTMAYAHARGVIHRDLKPTNIMVGSFGEVQVMDWGLAKVLPQGGIADEGGSRLAQETVIMTVRSGPAGSNGESQPGSVLGTPSYMAPEQARGEVERVDERVDVFGLGAILCEILTGRPPFGGSSRNEIRAKAARGDLTDARRRLDASGADAELISLARDCLAAEPEQRLRTAGEVARRLSAYQVGVQERLRAAELARVEAQTRAEEERKRRRVTVALAASVVGLFLSGSATWAELSRQRTERIRQLDRAASGVELQYAEANRYGDDLTRWAAAREAAHALGGLLADAPEASTRNRLAALVREVAASAAMAETDRKLLAELADIRGTRIDDPEGRTAEARYADAFREARIGIESVSPTKAASKIRDRPAAVRVAIAIALDDWASARRTLRRDLAGATRLTEIARLGDPEPWRDRLRAVLQIPAATGRLAALRDLARSERLDELPAVSVDRLAVGLLDLDDATGAEAVCRGALRRYPGDAWLNYHLARCLERQLRLEEAIRYYMAARSIQPGMAHDLAHALERKGEPDRAIAVFQDLAHQRPSGVRHLACLGQLLKKRGRAQEARDALDRAVAVARAAVGPGPGDLGAHFDLGWALFTRADLDLGSAVFTRRDLDEAMTEFREAIRLQPDSIGAHGNLGAALLARGRWGEAIAEFREVIRLQPNDARAHSDLGASLARQGEWAEAITECREAIRLRPDDAEAHNNLSYALRGRGDLSEAITECREALRLQPDYALGHINLGAALQARGRWGEAIAEYREALRLQPDSALVHTKFGTALHAQGEWDEAIAECHEALRLQPDSAEAHFSLANALRDRGKRGEAIAEFREALRLKPDFALAHNNLGNALAGQGDLNGAIVEIRAALRLRPDYAEAHYNLGNALGDQGKSEEAIAEYRAALRLRPDYAEAHNNLGNALAGQGDLNGAIVEIRAALRLRPDYTEAHNNLGAILCDVKRDYTDAEAEFREVIRLKPGVASAHANLGNALRGQGEVDGAIVAYREAIRLQPDLAVAHRNLGVLLHGQEKWEEAIIELREALRLEPDSAKAHYDLGVVLGAHVRIGEAIDECRRAIRLQPDYAEAHCNLGHFMSRQGRYAESLLELKRGHELGSRQPNWPYPSAHWVREAERLVDLEKKVPAMISGEAEPGDAGECLRLAQICYQKGLHAASARYWDGAFKSHPPLADDMQAQHRYNAACAAALAGCGQGKDDPPLDDAAKARWRKQAIDWLEADLAAWSKVLASGPPQARQSISQTLQHWKADPDLAGLREPAAVAKLSEKEQRACRALWTEVDALLVKAPSATTR
jgi:serine/threonine-protein kinase